MKMCSIQGCENELSQHARLDVCPQCRSVERYWMDKRPSEVLERQRKLVKWQYRMEHLSTVPGGRKHGKAIRKFESVSRQAH